MSLTTKVVVSPVTPNTPLGGQPLPYEWLKFFQGLAQSVNAALTLLGQFDGQIGASATVVSHTGTLANAIQHLNSAGVIQAGGIDFAVTAPSFAQVTGVATAAQLPAATALAQGALILPASGGGSTLGSAAFQSTTAFDAAGAATAAQTNAETFSKNANNISGGNLGAAYLPAQVPVISYGVGAPAAVSTEGYIYFDTTGAPYQGYVYHSAAWVKFA